MKEKIITIACITKWQKHAIKMLRAKVDKQTKEYERHSTKLIVITDKEIILK